MRLCQKPYIIYRSTSEITNAKERAQRLVSTRFLNQLFSDLYPFPRDDTGKPPLPQRLVSAGDDVKYWPRGVMKRMGLREIYIVCL